MPKLTLVLCFLLGLFFAARAQDFTYQGIVKDAETDEVIPFAHCKVAHSNKGFVTNRNGVFSYRSTQKRLEVQISSIGYQSKTLTLYPTIPQTITLHADTKTLSEVVVTPVDRERLLLQKVLDNITKNYPQTTERLTGSMVEQLAKDSLYQSLIYTAHATAEADKLTYANKNVFGNVKVTGGEVQYHMPMDSTFVRIIAGMHNIHRFDVIAARMQPFDNINTKSYLFELVDTLAYENTALFKMHFETAKFKGFLYIQDSTFALVKADYTAQKSKLNDFGLGSNRLFLNFISEYYRKDGFYRISYINYQTGFSRKDKGEVEKVYLNNFFYFNSYSPTKKLIGYGEQTNFSDALIYELPTKKLEVTEYNESKKPSNHSDKKKRGAQLFKKLSITQGLGIMRYKPEWRNVKVNALGINETFVESYDKAMIAYGIGYNFSNALGVEIMVASTLNEGEIQTSTLQAKWNRPFTKNRRWVLGLNGGINYTEVDLPIGKQISTAGGNTQETSFAEGFLRVKEQSRQINLAADLQIQYRIGARFYVVINGHLPFSWKNDADIVLSQDKATATAQSFSSSKTFDLRYTLWGIGLVMK